MVNIIQQIKMCSVELIYYRNSTELFQKQITTSRGFKYTDTFNT